MAPNLFGDRYAGRKAGWHNLGHVFKSEIDAINAVVECGLDFEIELRPLFVDLGGVMSAYGKQAIVRTPVADDNCYRVLGEATQDYHFLQNRELATLINPLTQEWPVESVGALGMGETVWFCLNAGAADVKGDPIQKYFVLHDTRDGITGLGIMATPVRTECQNTLDAGKAAAIASASLRHTASLGTEVAWHVGLMKEMQAVEKSLLGHFDAIAELTLTEADIDMVLQKAYPFPRQPRKVNLATSLSADELAKVGGLLEAVRVAEKDYTTAIDRVKERREACRQMFGKFNDTVPNLSGTGWALYNAVVETEDYREPVGKEDADLSMLFGERARTVQRAFGAVYQIARPDLAMAVVR